MYMKVEHYGEIDRNCNIQTGTLGKDLLTCFRDVSALFGPFVDFAISIDKARTGITHRQRPEAAASTNQGIWHGRNLCENNDDVIHRVRRQKTTLYPSQSCNSHSFGATSCLQVSGVKPDVNLHHMAHGAPFGRPLASRNNFNHTC